jgi:hypothetical protein
VAAVADAAPPPTSGARGSARLHTCAMPARAERDCPADLEGNPSATHVLASTPFEVLGPTGRCELVSYRCRYGNVSGVTVRGTYGSGMVVCRTELPHPDSLRGPDELARDELVAAIIDRRSATARDYARAHEQVATSETDRLVVMIRSLSLSFAATSYANAWAGAGMYEQTFVVLAGQGSRPSEIQLRNVDASAFGTVLGK